MLTEQLTNREDLVEALDTEPVFDYLLQHGVLGEDDVDGICNEETRAKRNTALLRHVEGNGNNAVALFINALRQSGQLHLASSLDVTQRIKPIYGTGYWEKQRHKGQVIVTIRVQAVKVLVPQNESPQKTRCKVSRELVDVKLTPRRLHKSYENMTMLECEEASTPKPIRILEYSYGKDEEDEEEEPIKPKKSCFCLCFPIFCRKKSSKEKKYIHKRDQQPHPKQSSQVPTKGRTYSPHRTSPTKQKHCSPSRGGNSTPSSKGEMALNGNSHSDSRRNSASPKKETSVVEYKNNLNERWSHSFRRGPEDKENNDPVIMRYNGRLELVELKRLSQRVNVNMSENGSSVKDPIEEMVEKWKSEGKRYEEKALEFYTLFDHDLKNSVIKYFEQDRGTLILQVFSEDSGISIFNICMTKDQVAQLHEDYDCGTLQKKMEKLLLANGTLDKLEISGINLQIQIDDEQFEEALQELT